MTTLANTLKKFFFEDTPSFETRGPSFTEGPRDCVLVIDASYSMFTDDWKPTRLDGAKDAAIAFAERLSKEQPDSRVGIVVFGCNAKVVCRLTAARELSKIRRKIVQIDTEGTTNMYAGLKKAHSLLRNRNRTCQVVLLTDGQNTGRKPVKLAERLKEFATIECIGIGGSPDDVDEDLLKAIASSYPNGEKHYRWIGQKDQLIKHFHNLAGAIRRA